MKLLRNLGGMLSVALLLGLLVFSAPAGAQSLTALSLERTLTLNNILTTVTPTIPASVAAALASGAIEAREQAIFNPQTNTLTSNIFLVPSGSPVPTNLALLPFSSFVAVVTTAIDKIVFKSNPVSAVTITGNVVQSTATPYGSVLGSYSTFSFGYSSDKPPKISNVIETEAGYIVLYSAAAQGTVTITQPTTGGGGGSAGITVVVNGATATAGVTFQTVSNLITLDSAGTATSNAGATLKYLWTVAPGSPSATITDNDTKKATVQLDTGKGTYIIQLKVTDSTGASVTVNITIQFI